MWHMITDNLQAYRRAVADTAKAKTICKINPHSDNQDYYRDCYLEEQVRLDGLMSIIGMVVKDAAAAEPHNPFSINGDVNQDNDTAIADATTSRLERAVKADPQTRSLTTSARYRHGDTTRQHCFTKTFFNALWTPTEHSSTATAS